MLGPEGFIEEHGEIFEIRRDEKSIEAQGLAQSKGRKHIQFLPDTDVQVGDVLYGTISHNELRVIEIERQNYGKFGVIINAYYDNSTRLAEAKTNTSINTINIHTMANSTLQQASPGATQSLAFRTEHKVNAQEIVAELLARVGELGLNEKQQEEVTAEAETIKAQLKLEKPKSFVIKECFSGIRGIIQGAVKTGGPELGAWFVKEIEQLLVLWQS